MVQYICPALTALNDDLTIDVASNLKLYDKLTLAGIDGIVLFGSSGECPHLSADAKKALFEKAIPYIKKNAACYAGTGGMDADECIELSNYALKLGADAVMVVSPFYFALDAASVERFYAKVAENVQGDIIIYNYPDRTGYSIEPETLLKLAQKYSNIIGLKDTVPDMAHTVKVIQTVKSALPCFRVYSGFDNNFAYNALSGGDGCIAALSNILPEVCTGWRDAVNNGDPAKAARYQSVIDRLMAVYGLASPFMPAMKFLLKREGVFASEAISFPYAPLDASKDAHKQQTLLDLVQAVNV